MEKWAYLMNGVDINAFHALSRFESTVSIPISWLPDQDSSFDSKLITQQ